MFVVSFLMTNFDQVSFRATHISALFWCKILFRLLALRILVRVLTFSIIIWWRRSIPLVIIPAPTMVIRYITLVARFINLVPQFIIVCLVPIVVALGLTTSVTPRGPLAARGTLVTLIALWLLGRWFHLSRLGILYCFSTLYCIQVYWL